MRGIFLALCGLALAAAAPLPAIAAEGGGLKVCNSTDGTVRVAIGYRKESGWQSEGWIAVARGSCATMLSGPLSEPYYYVHAVDTAAGAWLGNTFLCARESDFHVFGVDDCLARGYTRTPFFEIETHGARDWRVNLQGPGATPAVIRRATTVWSQSTPVEAAQYRLDETVIDTPHAALTDIVAGTPALTAQAEIAAAVRTFVGSQRIAASKLRLWTRADGTPAPERISFYDGPTHIATFVRSARADYVLGIEPGR